MMLFEYQSALVFIQSEYLERSMKNPNYSLRSFARNIGISHSSLSEVFSGKTKLTKRFVSLIASYLDLSQDETRYLQLIREIEFPTATSPIERLEKEATSLRLKYLLKEVQEDEFLEPLRNWYDFVILTILSISKGISEIKGLARSLAISQASVEASLQTLTRCGLVTKLNGKWTATGKHFKSGGKAPNAAVQRFHVAMIGKAIDAIQNLPYEERYVFTTIFPLENERFQKYCQKIQEISLHLADPTQASGNGQRIYGLSMQLFPLSREVTELC